MSNSDYANQNLANVLKRIEQACNSSLRTTDSVKLVGASKKQSIELISSFVDKGLKDLGENYLQEAIDKQCLAPKLDAQWHFIGQIQSNKTKAIAKHFSWVHGVDRLKVATRLSQHSSELNNIELNSQKTNILIQLNPDNEDTKGGVSIQDAPQLCLQIAELDNIKLRGFMMIPQVRQDYSQQRAVFASARTLLEQVNQTHGLDMDHLSMGMSSDLEAAIAEGSTMVRIGTDLFGARS